MSSKDFTLQVLVSPDEDYCEGIDVVCFDANIFPNTRMITEWRARNQGTFKTVLLLRDGTYRKNLPSDDGGGNFSHAPFDGILNEDPYFSILSLVTPLWRFWQGEEDVLPPEETMGGVTPEEFEETLYQTSLTDGHPDKRD